MTEKPIPPDPNRRRFFRLFAGDVANSVGSMIGVVQALQETSSQAARDLLSDPAVAQAPADAPAVAAGPVDVSAANAGYRAPFRWMDDTILVVDQRRLPDVLADIEVNGAADAINAMNDGAIVGAPVQAQLAAATLAVVAMKSTGSRPFARRATIRGAANAFRLSRPASAPMGAALDRMIALLETMVGEENGEVVARVLKDEADAIISEASSDHGAVVEHMIPILPGGPDEPLHVMLVGSTGPMGSGTFGTALSAVVTMHHDGRKVHALVPEGRPGFEGSRIAAWELKQAGVPYAVLTDAAAPGCIADDEVKAILASADRIAANGDAIATAGTYPIALAAYAAGVPFLVCATTNAVDLRVLDGVDAKVEVGRQSMVLRAMGQKVAPDAAPVRNPVQELVPAQLITAIVLETGVITAPYEEPLAAAIAKAAERRAGAAGFAALLAKRAAEAAEAAAAVAAGNPVPAPAAHADLAALRTPMALPQPWPDGKPPAADPAGNTEPAGTTDPAGNTEPADAPPENPAG